MLSCHITVSTIGSFPNSKVRLVHICVNPISNKGLQISPTIEACPYLIQKYSDWPVIDQEYNSVSEFFYNFCGVCLCKSFENELKK